MNDSMTESVLMLEGPQTAREAARTRDILLEALRARQDLVVNCDAVTDADLCLAQALIAASRSAAARGFGFSLQAPPAGSLRDTLVRGGLLPRDPDGPATDPAGWRIEVAQP